MNHVSACIILLSSFVIHFFHVCYSRRFSTLCTVCIYIVIDTKVDTTESYSSPQSLLEYVGRRALYETIYANTKSSVLFLKPLCTV